MAATTRKSKKKQAEESLSLSYNLRKTIGYADFSVNPDLFYTLQIRNAGAENIEDVTLTVENGGGFLLPFSQHFDEIPADNTLEISAKNLISPLYLAQVKETAKETVTLKLVQGKNIVAQCAEEITVLPFDNWGGKECSAESLAGFVRPKTAQCVKILDEAKAQLKKWDIGCEWRGYSEANGDKNYIRKAAAAIYSAVRKLNLTKDGTSDYTQPFCVGKAMEIYNNKVGTAFEAAIFVAACLEKAELNPVIVFGDKNVAVGVWLYDNCFTDTVLDDTTLLAKYISDGINNISVFDTEDLFDGNNANYTRSEKHFAEKLNDNCYDTILDIRRCRLARIKPLPLRVKGRNGYELLSERDLDPNAAPEEIHEVKKLKYDGKATRNKQWERRLLDLSLKNSLLNFRPAKALHIISADANAVYESVSGGGAFAIAECLNDVRVAGYDKTDFCDVNKLAVMKDLLRLELKNKRLRTFSDKAETEELLRTIVRKGKTAEEETGANVLHLAFGFLKWYETNGKNALYAPLLLLPVRLTRSKGGKGFSVVAAGELQINTTLLEFLLREFNIDIRGLENVSGLKVSEVIAMVNIEVMNMPQWALTEDVYLANFSFAGYAMWYDIKTNINIFKNNPMVKSLIDGRLAFETNMPTRGEDEYASSDILMPMSADSSQFDAIAAATAGNSFVLHGPPGTGKSQTITNIIANMLNRGKRVLFVAEKQAALSVVKKRLDAIGLGDFCLEVHSHKADKEEILKKLNKTLSLQASQTDDGFEFKGEQIEKLRAELNAPIEALHKERNLGISVYEAILRYENNKDAPDIFDIENTFYDKLTKEKLETYERLLLDVAASARESGGVYHSPFENVNLREYNADVRNRVYFASEALLAEIKHLRNYMRLFLDFYRQRISAFTQKKLTALTKIIDLLSKPSVRAYFNYDETQFHIFFNANKRLNRELEEYYKTFKSLPEIDAEPEVIRDELEKYGALFKRSKLLNSIAKTLKRAAIAAIPDAAMAGHIGMAAQIIEDISLIKNNTGLSANFTDRRGKLDFKRRDEYLGDLMELHNAAETVFIEFNADSFNSVCVKSASGCTLPILGGLKNALEGFVREMRNFCRIISANSAEYDDEDLLGYFGTKAGSIIDNIDMLAAWCNYNRSTYELDKVGLKFIRELLESGKLTAENVLGGFRKNVYRNFVETNLNTDPVLSEFSAAVFEEDIELFKNLNEQYSRCSREHIRNKLIKELPDTYTEGALSLEVMAFQRIFKSNMRGMTMKGLFAEIPELIKKLAPCMLMSPITVAQYLGAETDMFDLVIFDEASQLPTSEAVGALARAKSAVIVGDPKQLPPTSFFASEYVDEENLDMEDLESILDDCLALGMPEKYLNWHYRSKHESLIAFSNIMYYGNHLRTFPSPDALETKVSLRYIEDGVYDRGFTKRNAAEGDALIAEVIQRLKNPKTARSSIGIVTFSAAQQDYIERKLTQALIKNKLEDVAYEREEPLFVKNLENVQGDERDVILFSICYGPDSNRRVSLNFGPLNQSGGWRRLNVAVSRAREEMIVFSSMTSAMINSEKTTNKGVLGVKAFLEFAEKGRTTLAVRADKEVSSKNGIGKFIAKELKAYGYECRYDVGISDFKIDCAVIDPKNRKRFILAVLCDGDASFKSSAKDRNVLQPQTLKLNNWNVMRMFTVNFVNNPKREIKRIKEVLDRLTGAETGVKDNLHKYRKQYKFAKIEEQKQPSAYIVGGENDKEIIARLKAIIAAEEPISEEYLIKRCLDGYGINNGAKCEARLKELAAQCPAKRETLLGRTYLRKTDKCLEYSFFRVTEDAKTRSEAEITPYEVIALIKGLLENHVSLYFDELLASVCRELKIIQSDATAKFVADCLAMGVDKLLFVRSASDRITLY